MDNTVDHGGYLNHDAIILKTITVAGLPLDDVPVVELWDSSGRIFISHNGWKPSKMCTWDNEHGDGFFRASGRILGDFLIICRFGGDMASKRDLSTVIFQYQDNTGKF